EGDGEHAHVIGERAAVISDDQRRARAVEVLEPVDAVAVIALQESPVGEPEAKRGATRRHYPARRSVAPEERPAPTPIMRRGSQAGTGPEDSRRWRLIGMDAAPTLPVSWTTGTTRAGSAPSARTNASSMTPFG